MAPESRPTDTAGRFEMALAFERELGLDDWEEAAPHGRGVHLTFCQKPRNRLVTLTGRLENGQYFLAIDLRLQSHAWMNRLVERGGELVVKPVGIERLDQIATEERPHHRGSRPRRAVAALRAGRRAQLL